MKAYILNTGIALLIQNFAKDGGEWLTSCSSPFTPEREKKKKVPNEMEAGTPRQVQVTLLKVNGKAVPVHTTKAYILNRGIAMLIQNFAKDGGQWLTSCSGPISPEKKNGTK